MKEETLKQQERIAVAQMTPEQRREYYRRKELERKKSEYKAEERFKIMLYCCACITVAILYSEIKRVGWKRTFSI